MSKWKVSVDGGKVMLNGVRMKKLAAGAGRDVWVSKKMGVVLKIGDPEQCTTEVSVYKHLKKSLKKNVAKVLGYGNLYKSKTSSFDSPMFVVMEYVKGDRLVDCKYENNVTMLSEYNDLMDIFSDVHDENVIVCSKTKKLKLIDYGFGTV